jgi:hypothetical protein
MGIFARIRGFFASCIRPSTSSSLNNEEYSRLAGPSVDSLQTNSSKQAPSTSTAGLNYDQVSNDYTSNRVRKPVYNKASISQRESSTATTASQPNIKPPYFLQTFISSLNSSQKGKPCFTPASDVVYFNEWTACTAIFLDESSHRLSPQHTLELSSDSRVEFRDCKLQNGCLQFSMKACNAETITIFFHIQKYADSFTLSKKICVRYDPCSTAQAEMTIKRINESSSGSNECVFQVSIIDVWGVIVSHESCKLEILSSGENEVIQKKRMHSEAGHIDFEITVRGKEPWSKDFVLIFNGQPIPNAEKIEVFDKLRGLCCRALEGNEYESIPDFIEFYGSHIFIPLSIGYDDGKFLPYNEDNCELLPGACQILCKNTKRDEILGSGFAHVNKIAQDLQLREPPDIHEIQAENIVVIDLCNVHPNRYNICKEVVQHLLRGLYYRKKASEAAAVRMEWKNRVATLSKLLGASPSMRVCRNFRDHFGNLMNRYNREACDELFTFFNFHRDVSEVDLHGLYVADEKKLEMLRLDLLRGLGNDKEIKKIVQQSKLESFNGQGKQALNNELLSGTCSAYEVKDFIKCCRDSGMSQKNLKVLEKDLVKRSERRKEVNEIIKTCRAEGDEAIWKLKVKLDNFDLQKAIKNSTPWLEIIVGAGRHSRIKNEQNIRPKVEKLLKERNLQFTAVNKGSLVVTFQTYSGPEPCFGEYYCKKCDRCWKSSKSYVGKYQKCARCEVNCWPVKQREKEKVVNYHRDVAVARQPKPHQSSRYQKHQKLDRPCNAGEEECVII